jgi:hypothetical protein
MERPLDVWPEVVPQGEEALIEHAFLKHLRSGSAVASNLERVIRDYLKLHKGITFSQLRQALQESMEWREYFHALGCRGFSYKLDLTMRGYNSQHWWGCQLTTETNLRVALIPEEKLFYPARVKSFLWRTRWHDNHYFQNELPSIAFSIGKKIDRAWYVFVMQSDVESKGPSYVREHFRGWRKVLFANIVAQARGKVDTLYLCRAKDAARACFPGTMEVEQVPQRWMNIYDLTAAQWGMRLVKVSKPVDMQMYRRRKPILSQHFYELRLTRK